MKLIKTSVLALLSLTSVAAFANDCGCPETPQDTVALSTLADPDGNILANTTLTCDNLYRLDKKIYVPDGLTMTIQAGTIIKGQPGTGLDATALIVTRGGKLNAVGTESCPIIFTAEADQLDGCFPVTTTAQWGGVIMLGKATNNLLLADGGLAVADGVGTIEGLDVPDPRHHYGAAPGAEDDNDNSGVLRHVSIRHGGAVIGADNEINGLTLGSVGRGTTLEHIEVVSNEDDGIEFFGGTVDIKYATVLFCKDDYIDWDQGYSGRGQFIFGAQLPGASAQGDHGMEIDGDDKDSDNVPLSDPTFFNVTIIGNATSDNNGINAKENTHGEISNSVFANFDRGVNLDNSRAVDAEENYVNGDLVLRNNTFIAMNIDLAVGEAAPAGAVATQFANDGNVSGANSLVDFTLDIDAANCNTVVSSYNAVPAAGTVDTDLMAPIDEFFAAADYRGAFCPGVAPWTAGGYGANLGADAPAVPCPTDINNDGVTNNSDFLLLLGQFNASCAN